MNARSRLHDTRGIGKITDGTQEGRMGSERINQSEITAQFPFYIGALEACSCRHLFLQSRIESRGDFWLKWRGITANDEKRARVSVLT